MNTPVDPLLASGVADFGRALGLSGFALDDQGQARLKLPSGQQLRLLASGEALLVQLECPLGFEGPELLERALVAAGARQRFGSLQLGLRGRGSEQVLIVGRRLPARGSGGASIGRTAEQLMEWFDALRQAGPSAVRAGSSPASLFGFRP